jgi:hypothetical protein
LAIGILVSAAGPALAGEARKASVPTARRTSACAAAAEAKEVRRVRAVLAGIRLSADDDGNDAPAAARAGIPALRAALAAVIAGHMQCSSSARPADAAAIAASLAKLLDANINTGDAAVAPYGGDLRIAVKAVPTMAGVLAVDASFGIPCGQDHVLAMFERRPEGWRRILDWRAAKFDRVSDAFGDFFEYAAVPGSGSTRLIAVAHDTPWCTSAWSRFAVDLIAPAAGTAPQTLLAHDTQGYNRGDDPLPVTFAATADGLVIRAPVPSHDAGLPLQEGIFHYRTSGNRLERLPVAPGRLHFVDAWLSEPWSVASRWSAEGTAPKTRAALKAVHDRLTAKGAPAITWGTLRECRALKASQLQMKLGDGSRLYALIASRPGNVHAMLAITPQPDRACTGPDFPTLKESRP